jgi:hypothetical protein
VKSGILALVALFSASSALASTTIPVMTREIDNSSRTDVSFAYNSEQPQLGRTWVSLTVYGDDEGESSAGEFTADVAGLKFDASTKSVVYVANGKTVLCSQDRGFWHGGLVDTGKCKLAVTETDQLRDDGHSRRSVHVARVTLTVKE